MRSSSGSARCHRGTGGRRSPTVPDAPAGPHDRLVVAPPMEGRPISTVLASPCHDTAVLRALVVARRLLRSGGMRVFLVAVLALVGCGTPGGAGDRADGGPGPEADAAPVVDAPPPLTPDDPGAADVR